jgi:hypothetical protein
VIFPKDVRCDNPEWDESESTSSYCTSIGPLVDSPHSLLFECGLEVESDEVETLFCQCDNENAFVECLSCGSCSIWTLSVLDVSTAV